MMTTAAAKEARQGASDLDVIQRVLGGEKNAFELLMRRYNRPLYRTARSILKDDADAEDALQESYLLAYRNLHLFRGDSSLATWLTRIVVNESVARLRKTARRAQIIELGANKVSDEHRYEDAMPSMSPMTAEPPEHSTARAEMRGMIERKIDALPESFRVVFMLRAIEEMTVEETAACLGIPEATVRTRYFRAKSLLRESLSREIDFALEEAFAFDGARCDRIVEGVMQTLSDPSSDRT
ncbi:RNA polymerase sigma factor [Noviherbaspirillum malthae]|uniref:RNA polymerase sigma factor n=1 Tax=Noviherbaspirillum malthae TaxID=1260987 RepID=UPI001E28352D|nr:RNA polymerase sigma factor [Noviherbaspirillum malthae]